MSHLGCEIMAGTFTWIVESEVGRALYNSATDTRCTCCETGKQSCPSGCADLQTDTQNCGKCGNVCSAGQSCKSGQCVDQGCASPEVCGTFVFGACGGSSSCVCYTAASGTGGCSTDFPCAGLSDCGSDVECGPVGFCAVGTCCGRNVCIPAVCSNQSKKMLRAVKRGQWVEGSTLQPGHWAK
jgi:hypothetical protein